MKKYFSLYIKSVLEMLDSPDTDFDALEKELLIKISFMQHERLIHLIVTVLFATVLFLSIIIFFISGILPTLLLSLLILALLIPYIAHYFFLENNVQKLYTIYDRVKELQHK